MVDLTHSTRGFEFKEKMTSVHTRTACHNNASMTRKGTRLHVCVCPSPLELSHAWRVRKEEAVTFTARTCLSPLRSLPITSKNETPQQKCNEIQMNERAVGLIHHTRLASR